MGFLGPAVQLKAVDGVTLKIRKGEILGLVGESGSGKTTLGRAAIGLQKVSSGRVVLFTENKLLVDVSSAKGTLWKKLRGIMQMIFQDPFTSIDPNMKVFDVLRIPLEVHGIKNKKQLEFKIVIALGQVGLPTDVLKSYVFELSGGQRQRLGIARTLSLDPILIVADEPVSMLDASIKGDILRIICEVSDKLHIAFLFITHEMAVARLISDRIAVMYLGQVVELGASEAVVSTPLHPYTKALLQATPKIDPSMRNVLKEIAIRKNESSDKDPGGCKFHPRCPYVMNVCVKEVPPLKEKEIGHSVACWLY